MSYLLEQMDELIANWRGSHQALVAHLCSTYDMSPREAWNIFNDFKEPEER